MSRAAFGENVWFFVILTGLLLSAGSAVVQPPVRVIAFWGVLLVHIAGYWLGVRVPMRPIPQTVYLIGQGIAVVLLVGLSASPVMALTGFTVLMAVSIGLFGLTRRIAIAILCDIITLVACFIVLGGVDLLSVWVTPISLNLVLVLVFMGLYRRQLDARETAQAALTQLAQANHQLTAYAEQVEHITLAMERGRMARELHDTLAQGLAGLILQMEAIANHLQNGRDERAQAILQQAMIRARTTLTETRSAIDDLRGEGGNVMLSQRLHAKVTSLLVGASITPHLEMTVPSTIRVAHKTADHALHIIGELIHNVIRHAHAPTVWVTVSADQALTLTVRDDGVGFAPKQHPVGGHYGLQGVRERVALVGGSIHIDSAPQAGTTIRVELPLEGN